MKSFGGKVLFLNKSDINTDEIIPAKYLTEITKDALKPYLLEDLKLEGFNQKTDLTDKKVIIAKENFGCGSSREHAPWALEVNDITLVIAPSFARIYRQNMYNCGMIAVELDNTIIDDLFNKFAGKEVELQVNLNSKEFIFKSGDICEKIGFKLNDYDEALVKAGGWVNYADKNY